ncbi:hypothetical protein [Pseudomonas sp. Kh13]|uniref:hypothetical protein n=1 Tax=Pseudomonas sp. Kh13 TaxID=2093744 RepID=UPI001181FD5C|nr:hypothetical protein [Pseudomonas sp. Kh13]
MDNEKAAAIADTLELLHQIALRASVEEVSTWIRQRGSINVHENTMVVLQALDTNAEALASVIERLRQ